MESRLATPVLFCIHIHKKEEQDANSQSTVGLVSFIWSA